MCDRAGLKKKGLLGYQKKLVLGYQKKLIGKVKAISVTLTPLPTECLLVYEDMGASHK